jgi:thiol-disulfide isomerase/thioredoxin
MFLWIMKKPSTFRHRRTRRNLAIGLIAFAALFAGLVAITRPDSGADHAPAPDIALDYFNGDSQQLGDLVGRPVVLNFWASWCPACVAEMPAFGEVHRRLGDRAEFIGVNMQEVDMDAAMALVEQTGVEYRLVHDLDGAIYRQFGGVAMPTTVFITESGEIARVHSGTIFEADLEALIERELLG